MSETMEMAVAGEVRSITAITDEIIFYKNVGGQAVIEIGKRLIEAKAQLKHGEWLPWLSEKVEFSETSAQRFMQLAREYGNTSLVGDLGTSKALVLLALPASERENFASEKHIVNGEEKSAAEMSKRELEDAEAGRKAAEEQAAALRAELDKARKSAAAMDNKALAEFAVLFRQAQETVNRMTEIVDELDEESRPKVYRALGALRDMIAEKAGEGA